MKENPNYCQRHYNTPEPLQHESVIEQVTRVQPHPTEQPKQECKLIRQKERSNSQKNLLNDYLSKELRPFTKHITANSKPKADLRQVLQLLTAKIAVKHKSHHQLYSVIESGQENEDDVYNPNIYQPHKRRQLLSLNEQQLLKKADSSVTNTSSEANPKRSSRMLRMRIKNKTNSSELHNLKDKENLPPSQNSKLSSVNSRQYLNLGVTFAELLKGKPHEQSVGSIGSYIGSPLLIKSNQSIKSTSHSSRPTAVFTEFKDKSRCSGSPQTRGGPIKVARLIKNGSPRQVTLSCGYSSFDNYFETQSKGT